MSPYLPSWGRLQARIQKFFKGGGLRKKILKEKCLLIHVSTRVHIKTRQTCNSTVFYFLLCFYYSLLFLKSERGGCNPRNPNPPLDPPMGCSRPWREAAYLNLYIVSLPLSLLRLKHTRIYHSIPQPFFICWRLANQEWFMSKLYEAISL